MSIRKIAYFVEGYTEQEFVKKYLINLFAQKELAIDVKSIQGGSSVGISYTTVSSIPSTSETKYYFMIYNCNGDNAIKSYIKARRKGLIDAGYEKIIGLRDVYPDVSKNEIQKLHDGMYYQMPQANLPTKFILCIMEIEAWFLSEEKHFTEIHPELTVEKIKSETGFDPINDSSEEIDEPAGKLNSIYQLCGKSYKKKYAKIDRTIKALDMANIYMEARSRNSSLEEFLSDIDALFE